MINTSLGTEYEINTKDKILFIEETSEYVYNVDKMINHLHMAGKFEDCKGIIFGDFDNCRKVRDEDWSVEDIVDEIAKLYKNQQFIIYKVDIVFQLEQFQWVLCVI